MVPLGDPIASQSPLATANGSASTVIDVCAPVVIAAFRVIASTGALSPEWSPDVAVTTTTDRHVAGRAADAPKSQCSRCRSRTR